MSGTTTARRANPRSLLDQQAPGNSPGGLPCIPALASCGHERRCYWVPHASVLPPATALVVGLVLKRSWQWSFTPSLPVSIRPLLPVRLGQTGRIPKGLVQRAGGMSTWTSSRKTPDQSSDYRDGGASQPEFSTTIEAFRLRFWQLGHGRSTMATDLFSAECFCLIENGQPILPHEQRRPLLPRPVPGRSAGSDGGGWNLAVTGPRRPTSTTFVGYRDSPRSSLQRWLESWPPAALDERAPGPHSRVTAPFAYGT